MKHSYRRAINPSVPAHAAARNAGLALAGVLRWCWVRVRSCSAQIAAAAERAEHRITEHFKVPPGGG